MRSGRGGRPPGHCGVIGARAPGHRGAGRALHRTDTSDVDGRCIFTRPTPGAPAAPQHTVHSRHSPTLKHQAPTSAWMLVLPTVCGPYSHPCRSCHQTARRSILCTEPHEPALPPFAFLTAPQPTVSGLSESERERADQSTARTGRHRRLYIDTRQPSLPPVHLIPDHHPVTSSRPDTSFHLPPLLVRTQVSFSLCPVFTLPRWPRVT